jgi:hypothetical protein
MLSFGSASMLWWGLAAVIPFVLHLWNRKPRQVVPFAATRFLVAATKRQSKRIKFQQWILLLTRVVILLHFALALAEPRWGETTSAIPTTAVTHHLLVIDDSYSMETEVEGETRLSLAKARLIEIVRTAPVGDLFSLVAMGEPVEVMIAGPSHDRAEMERAIRVVEARQVGAKVAPAISVARRLIEDSLALSAAPRMYRVTFASDLAGNTWSEVRPEQIEAELSAASPGCSWNLVLAGDQPPTANLAIRDFTTVADVVYFGQSISGALTVGNLGARPAENAIVEVRAGERTLFRDEVSLEVGQEQTIPWRIPPQRESMLLTARVDADDLEVDNRRFLSVEVRPAPRLLCLASSEVAARHVVMALTSGPVEKRPRVDVITDIATFASVPANDLSKYDAVILLNTAPPDDPLAEALSKFAASGGGVLIGLGDRSLNQGAAGEGDFYPATLGLMVKLDAPRVDPLNYTHPLLAAFREAPEAGLLSLPVWRYIKLEKLQASAKIAAQLDNGDALLVEMSVGRGKVVLFAGSLGAESIDASENPPTPWSGLPGSAAYVPLMQEWVLWCARREAKVGWMVGDAPPSEAVSGNAGWEYSDGESWRPSEGELRRLTKAGFYRWKDSNAQRKVISVNLNTKESSFVSERERFAHLIETRAPPGIVAAPAAGRSMYRSLSAWLLIPLALLVCGEIVLATLLRRGGRSRAGIGGVA